MSGMTPEEARKCLAKCGLYEARHVGRSLADQLELREEQLRSADEVEASLRVQLEEANDSARRWEIRGDLWKADAEAAQAQLEEAQRERDDWIERADAWNRNNIRLVEQVRKLTERS